MEYRPSKRRSNRQAQIARWFCSKKGAILQEYFVYFKKSQRIFGQKQPQDAEDVFD